MGLVNRNSETSKTQIEKMIRPKNIHVILLAKY